MTDAPRVTACTVSNAVIAIVLVLFCVFMPLFPFVGLVDVNVDVILFLK